MFCIRCQIDTCQLKEELISTKITILDMDTVSLVLELSGNSDVPASLRYVPSTNLPLSYIEGTGQIESIKQVFYLLKCIILEKNILTCMPISSLPAIRGSD